MDCSEQSGSCKTMMTTKTTTTTSSSSSSSSRAARRRRMDFRRVRSIDPEDKRRRIEAVSDGGSTSEEPNNNDVLVKGVISSDLLSSSSSLMSSCSSNDDRDRLMMTTTMMTTPKYGFASVCGRRRDMEDAVAIHPSFCNRLGGGDDVSATSPPARAAALHYFGVYDGHGCSHAATKCRERLHEVVKEEIVLDHVNNNNKEGAKWKCVMERSFIRVDEEVIAWNKNVTSDEVVTCRCELQSPECDAVGSTAVVAVVTPHSIVVANCGDSRAVLCRNGKSIPLSVDHKPDRPDELSRIQAAGGRVIYWEGARVLGVLAMSRAIGDNYLKPYVSCEPEVTITDRTIEDEFLILASDGLWDVVSNDTACTVVRTCLRRCRSVVQRPSSSSSCKGNDDDIDRSSDKDTDTVCNDASLLLTKLALARRSTDNVSVVVIDLRKNKKTTMTQQ